MYCSCTQMFACVGVVLTSNDAGEIYVMKLQIGVDMSGKQQLIIVISAVESS